MPILYSDIHTCEKCKKKFKWNYFKAVRNQMGSSSYFVDSIPADITLVHTFDAKENSSYDVGVNCPHCHYYNVFVYETDQ